MDLEVEGGEPSVDEFGATGNVDLWAGASLDEEVDVGRSANDRGVRRCTRRSHHSPVGSKRSRHVSGVSVGRRTMCSPSPRSRSSGAPPTGRGREVREELVDPVNRQSERDLRLLAQVSARSAPWTIASCSIRRGQKRACGSVPHTHTPSIGRGSGEGGCSSR